MTSETLAPGFASLGLPEPLLRAIAAVGYESPSPIQAESIPALLDGRDLLGQAQTGTGKTAAFALPLLSRLDPNARFTQMLVLTPTRELAIQVAEACQTYARFLPQFRVVPIYGGASYTTQIKQLKASPQVVVGTPGRVMDHIRRGTLKLDQLQALVLDEADEMLRMGFIDDVEWILEHTSAEHQTALFSATMPKQIQQVAQRYLHSPHIVKIASKTSTAPAITQRYWPISGLNKLDALTRILEVETIDGAIIFVRTKIATTELADKLSARGFAAEALNGDMAQAAREKVLDKMRNGRLDILIATDVAARGIDIARVSHVINYDIPLDTEAYVHRIGRTGRAGRPGEAILFVANREQRMLKAIERATNQPIARMTLPSDDVINAQRIEKFHLQIDNALSADDLAPFREIVTAYQSARAVEPLELAAALAKMTQGENSLLLSKAKSPKAKARDDEYRESYDDAAPSHQGSRKKKQQTLASGIAKPLRDAPDVAMARYHLSVGYDNGVKPSNIVGAIANEADIDSRHIGHIEIFDEYTLVDLPEGMPKSTLQHLKKVWVCEKQLAIRPLSEAEAAHGEQNRDGRRDNFPREKQSREKEPRDKPFQDKPFQDKPFQDKPFRDKPSYGKKANDKASERPRMGPRESSGERTERPKKFGSEERSRTPRKEWPEKSERARPATDRPRPAADRARPAKGPAKGGKPKAGTAKDSFPGDRQPRKRPR